MKRYGIASWDKFLEDFMRHWPTVDPHTYIDFVRDGNPRTGAATELRLCEQRTAVAKRVFQFDVQGQVATSTHAGLPWLLWLRMMPDARSLVHFWPFDAFEVPDAVRAVNGYSNMNCDIAKILATKYLAKGIELELTDMPPAAYWVVGSPEDYFIFQVAAEYTSGATRSAVGATYYVAVHKRTGEIDDLGYLDE